MEIKFISDETINMLNLLVQRMFMHNRLMDRGISVMSVRFAMHNFESIFHNGMAHKYPILADFFSEILTNYNILTNYLETPTDINDYSSPLVFFEVNLDFHNQTYILLKQAIDTAVENGDTNVEVELKKFMSIFNKYIAQSILLKDKANIFEDNYGLFDAYCNQYFILGD